MSVSKQRFEYRPEIDGLRAIAVVSVVLFHAKLPPFSGGYVGVDVFFVISGFLITRIIWTELQDDCFSLARFYERRARRILPALFAVILVCLPLGWYLMLPDPFQNFGQSIVASIFFGNNILLYHTAGYWDLSSEFKPLLHTWSLGVEEQFYVIVPLALMMLAGWRSNRVALLILITIVCSLALSEMMWRTAPAANFYLLPTRAWELLIGSLCAVLLPNGLKKAGSLVSAFGLAAILASIVFFDEATPFPSVWALMPVLGSAAVIMGASSDTFVGRFLSLPVMVGLGLISYSLYLWHQPVFAFARIASAEPLDTQTAILLSIACIVPAYFSWRFIEKPFRDAKKVSARPFVVTTFAVTCGLVVAGVALHLSNGVASRLYPGLEIDNPSGFYIAYNESARSFTSDDYPEGEERKVLVLGNSFGRDFVNMAEESGWTTKVRLVYRDDIDLCSVSSESISEVQLQLIDLAEIVIFSSGNYDLACAQDAARSLRNKDIRVLFVGPKHFGHNLNVFLRTPIDDRSASRSQVIEEVVELNERLAAEFQDSEYVDLIGAISADGRNVPVFDEEGFLLSADRVHLTEQGARFVGERIFARPPLNEILGENTDMSKNALDKGN